MKAKSTKKAAISKRTQQVETGRVTAENRMRFNPLQGITPSRFVRALDEYDAGRVSDLCRIIEAYEQRDDAFRTNSRKTYASVARCQHSINIVEGFEGEPDAQAHKDFLEKFWATIRVTSAFNRNETGGLRLLKRQMARSICFGHAVHEITWAPAADGSLRASFTALPPWMVETTTGETRWLPQPSALDGTDMEPGGWLVTTGDGIGIAAAICAMSKRLSINDWLAFCERCGQPGIHAKTDATIDSPEWKNLVKTVGSFGRNWAAVTGKGTDMAALALNTTAAPWPMLVDLCNRAIASLWRGGDLATVSAVSDTPGVTSQKDEKNILEEDFCEAISETLHEQVTRYAIEWRFGDVEPLAYLSVQPTTRPNTDADIKIDDHLTDHGVELSGQDALNRYGRSKFDPSNKEDFPLKKASGPISGLANEAHNHGRVEKPLKLAPERFKGSAATEMAPGAHPLKNASYGAFAKDMEKWRGEVSGLLKLPPAERPAAAKALADRVAADPAAAPALKQAMADWLATAYADAANKTAQEQTT
jgi:hypothetical protein